MVVKAPAIEASPAPAPTAPARLDVLLILMFAGAVYLRLFGAATLNPANFAWMLHGDPAQHYLGWQFFRFEAWQWPPGRIAGYGWPEGTSIGFTDAIPLLALLLKPWSGFLPGEFQYFGAWMLLCYLLNGVFGLRLLARMTESRLLRLLGACFFVLSPPLMLRGYGHEALMAHWLLLAGIDNCLGRWRIVPWLVLTILAALLHPYLLLMLGGLVFAHAIVTAWIDRVATVRRLLLELAGLGGVALGFLWLAGYLSGSGRLAAEGYGFFSMNLLAFIDPLLRWSRFMQAMPVGTEGQYEGFQYLGFGMILLAALALGIQLLRPVPLPRRWFPLLAVAGIFWLLALSNVVMLGSLTVLTVPLPDLLHRALSVFRASGRFGWLAFYLVMLAILVPIVRQLPPRRAAAVLVCGLVLQLVDQGGKHREFRQFIQQRMTWQTPLQAPRWEVLAAGASTLLILPPHPRMELIYLPFAHLAARHRLATNAAHLAHADADGMNPQGAAAAAALARGAVDPGTLYVFPQPAGLDRLPPDLRARVESLDGFHVLPPVPARP